MTTFDTIIPIGQTSNISYLLQTSKFKAQTTLFEWFTSNNLKDITSVLYKLGNYDDATIVTQSDNNIVLNGNIYSDKYNYEDFKIIYLRRRNRLLASIRTNFTLLFVRFEETNNVYTVEDIDDFINSVKNINPNVIGCKLVLIGPNTDTLEHNSLIKVFYDSGSSGSVDINQLFVNTLQAAGYNTNNVFDYTFDDSSIL